MNERIQGDLSHFYNEKQVSYTYVLPTTFLHVKMALWASEVA